jgi:hypothetical protein
LYMLISFCFICLFILAAHYFIVKVNSFGFCL